MRQRTKFNLPALKMPASRRQHRPSSGWAAQLLPQSPKRHPTPAPDIQRTPLLVLGLVAGLVAVGLGLQLLNLQIVQGERYRGIAEGNRVREQVTYAPRGRILDRNGVVLADNTPGFQLAATPYLLAKDALEREADYRILSKILEQPESTLAALAEKSGLEHNQPLLIAENIDHSRALQIEHVLPGLAGFTLDAVPRRSYKDEAALAHILGYVGRVSEAELEVQPELYPIDFIGKMGIEQQYDDRLRGQNGAIKHEVDASGRPLRTLEEVPTKPGQDIAITIDYKLQKHLAAAMKKQMDLAGVNRAAGVIIDPDSGEVLAMVSMPSYDNNLFAQGITPLKYQQLVDDPLQPMLNRTIAGSYPSGSIIKPLTLLGALETDTVDENTTIVDNGALVVQNQYDSSISYTYLGWNPAGLGVMNARRAIALSSNIYFYTVGGGHREFQGMGIDNLVKYYQLFGLGTPSGIDLPGEAAGRVPTPKWKQEHFGEGWFLGDTYNLSIGQGNLLVSPLQMARAHAAIASNGQLLAPQLLLEDETKINAIPEIDQYHYQIVREGMRGVVTGGGTTSPAVFADVPVPVAGKSGTAETNPGDRDSHAWFSAYAPYDDPQLLSVVLLEEGEGGSQFAAPAIAETFSWYFRQ